MRRKRNAVVPIDAALEPLSVARNMSEQEEIELIYYRTTEPSTSVFCDWSADGVVLGDVIQSGRGGPAFYGTNVGAKEMHAA